jgi:cobalt-zinc-cadmium efflux system outer membrane protein
VSGCPGRRRFAPTIAAALLALLARPAGAQASTRGDSLAAGGAAARLVAAADSAPVLRWSLAEFIGQVGRLNLDYAAQAFNVPIAQAQVSVAHLYPNPTLAWGTAFDVSGERQATNYDLTLSESLLLGGKRGARTDVARYQLGAAEAQLADFLRTLRATAATAYADAIHAEQVYARKRRTAEDLSRLVTLNAHRFAAGDIAEIDLAQSRVDAAQARAARLAAANDLQTARLALTGLLTPRPVDTLVAPMLPPEAVPLATIGPDTPLSPDLLVPTPVTLAGPGLASTPGVPAGIDVDSLALAAAAARTDIVAARELREAASAGVRVARGDRWPDLGLSVGGTYYTLGTSTIDPTPIFSALSLGISVPIPFSNLTHGEYEAAARTAAQANVTLQSTAWKAAIQVRQAWVSLQSALAQLGEFTGGALVDAERVRRAKLYSYEHGSASLLDVLVAEQTANDLYDSFYDAQQQYLHALIGLAQATDTWSWVLASDSTQAH